MVRRDPILYLKVALNVFLIYHPLGLISRILDSHGTEDREEEQELTEERGR